MKTKPAKLIFIPYVVTDYKTGTLVHFKNKEEDSIYMVDNVFETQQPDHIKFFVSFGPHTLPEKYLNGSVGDREPRTVQPYLISEEHMDASDKGKRYNIDTNKIEEWDGLIRYHSMLNRRKVLATPDQIGLVNYEPGKIQFRTLSRSDYQTIHMRSGNCEIELDSTGAIKLIDNKVIIHI